MNMFIMNLSCMPFRPSDSALPLTPISFEILLALLNGDLHGYAILQQVEARTAGVLPMRTGTLYRALARLEEAGLIDLVDGPANNDERRRYYRITEKGKRVYSENKNNWEYAKRILDQLL